jgi:chromosome segregation ATPase
MDESDRQKQDLIKLVDSDDRLGSLLQEIAKLRAEKKVLQTRNDDLVRRVQELQTNLWAVKKRLAEMDQSGNDGEETSTDMDGNGWDGSEEVFSNEEVADGD